MRAVVLICRNVFTTQWEPTVRVVRLDTMETRRVRAPGTAGPVRVHSQSPATTSAPAVMRTVRTMCVRSVPRATRAATATSEYRKYPLNTYQNKYSACTVCEFVTPMTLFYKQVMLYQTKHSICEAFLYHMRHLDLACRCKCVRRGYDLSICTVYI